MRISPTTRSGVSHSRSKPTGTRSPRSLAAASASSSKRTPNASSPMLQCSPGVSHRSSTHSPSARTTSTSWRLGGATSSSRTTTTPTSGTTTCAWNDATVPSTVNRSDPAMPWSSANSNDQRFIESVASRDRAERADLVALVDELLGGELDLVLREVVVLDALDHRPRRAVAAHRVAELQTLGDAVLAAAAHRDRVEVVPRSGEVHAVHRTDRRVRGRRRRRRPALLD